jgi:NAD(P)-dependent dehydrogenase (short-subunit alcohol dehydrogenase family)
MSLPELSGKVAVVTGGASGMGKAMARSFLAEEMEVVIADIEVPALEATSTELGVTGIPTDVADAVSVQALAGEVLERFGAVHVVCNNAGVSPVGRLADHTLDDWRWLIDTNLWGVIHGVTTFLPILEQNAEGGHIVNTSSIAGLAPLAEFGSYCVTKYGVLALTETLAIELDQAGSAVGVTVLFPGAVKTNINTSSRNRPAGLGPGGLRDFDMLNELPDARWIDPDEVGPMVVQAIKNGDLYLTTHPEFWPGVDERHGQVAKGFGRG